MDSKDFRTLNDAYRFVYEAKAESPEKEEEDMKKDDDLFGSPNKKVKEALEASGRFTSEEIENLIS